MKKKKTQSTMIVMAATLAMSGILQPITAYAQEEQVQEITTLTQSEDTFTKQDLLQALAKYSYTNETTGIDIQGHLNKTFSGKKYGNEIIRSLSIRNFVKVNATFENKGSIRFNVIMISGMGIELNSNLPTFSFEILRLQADFASEEEVKTAITEELKTYPYNNGTEEKEINPYLSDAFMGKTFGGQPVVRKITNIKITKIQKQEATLHKNGSITLDVSFTDNQGVNYGLSDLTFEIPSQYPLSNIPNEEFRQFLYENFDKDKDNNLSLEERNAVETINVGSTTIEDVSGIEIFHNLKNIYCNEKVRILDVSQNDKLEVLHCSNTQITGVDVSKNTMLQTLALGSTQISDIDLSGNPNLLSLDLNNTKNLKEIDISTNRALQALNLNSSSVAYLDAGKNTKLTILDVEHTNLAYLTLNVIPSEQFIINPAPVIQTQIQADSFHIQDLFPDIDISRISKWQNASFDTTTGIFSEYLPNTAITYEYAILPPVNKRATPTTMKVTLQIPKAYGYIHIIRASDVVYTGNPVANPTEIRSLEGAADPIFFYHVLVDGNWTPIQGNPVEVGSYRVDARVPENEHYLEAETSEEVTFEITQATNAWEKRPAIENWTYGEQPKDVVAEAKFGNVGITYSNTKTGVYIDQVPTEAGTWYMKASVEGTNNYTGLSDVVSFVIQPKNVTENPDIKIPDIKDDKDLEELIIKDGEKDLEKGKDYEVDKQQKGEETTITITFKDNYTGKVTKTYTTKSEEPKEQSKEESKEEPKVELKADVIKKTGDAHQEERFALWSILLAGCGIVAMKKKNKEEKQ